MNRQYINCESGLGAIPSNVWRILNSISSLTSDPMLDDRRAVIRLVIWNGCDMSQKIGDFRLLPLTVKNHCSLTGKVLTLPNPKNSDVDSYSDQATGWKTDESAFFPDVSREFFFLP